MDTQETKKEEVKETKSRYNVGDIVSVPFNGSFLKGAITDVKEKELTINNYVQGEINIPRNREVQKFFKGQKFDSRELNSEGGKAVNTFLMNTKFKNLDTLLSSRDKEAVHFKMQLLSGRLSPILSYKKLTENETGQKSLKDLAVKIKLYEGKDGLKFAANFKNEEKKVPTKAFGVELSKDQINKMVENKQSVVFESTTKTGKPFKIFLNYDKELNNFIPAPYSKFIEEKMKKAYEKKEQQTQKETKVEAKTKTTTTKVSEKNKIDISDLKVKKNAKAVKSPVASTKKKTGPSI